MVASQVKTPVAVESTISLIRIVKEFQDHAEQVRLVQWFQASTGEDKQATFALLWRDGQAGGAIDFVQVFRYYQALPHQNAALKWLEQNSHPKTLGGFARMWQSIPLGTAEIRLKVPFYQQLDNQFEPHRTCNTSSCAMVARYLGANISGDDHYYEYVRRHGDTTDHGAQTRALADIGIQSTWHTDLDYEDLDRSLEAKLPIVIGILHRGSLHAPTGGHMIVVIGRTAKRDYVCHDPYGSLLDPGGGYTGNVNNGNGVIYSRTILNRRWLVEGARSGWGRLFYGNTPPA